MHEQVLTPKFERAFRRLVGKNPRLQPQIKQTWHRMSENLSHPGLKTHHLSGPLSGLHACSVTYDCRIVFPRQKNPKTGAEVLLLVNRGSHEEVY
jgi:mRNA-degrading endonuclease YafQ of YafQ-DinJ toxin-antitoxin module